MYWLKTKCRMLICQNLSARLTISIIQQEDTLENSWTSLPYLWISKTSDADSTQSLKNAGAIEIL